MAPLDKRQDDLGFDINSEGDWTSTSWWEDGPEAASVVAIPVPLQMTNPPAQMGYLPCQRGPGI